MLLEHYRPKPPIVGGFFTCHFGGHQLGDPANPMADRRRACSRPDIYPANLPADGCSSWEREPGADDEIYLHTT